MKNLDNEQEFKKKSFYAGVSVDELTNLFRIKHIKTYSIMLSFQG